jgi:hypothetical protein
VAVKICLTVIPPPPPLIKEKNPKPLAEAAPNVIGSGGAIRTS